MIDEQITYAKPTNQLSQGLNYEKELKAFRSSPASSKAQRNAVTNEPVKVKPKPVFGGSKKYFMSCSCWIGGQNWCVHYLDYLQTGADAAQLVDAQSSKLKVELRYPILAGKVDAMLEMTNFGDIDTDPDDHENWKLSFDADTYVWMQPGDSAWTVLNQVYTVIENDPLLEPTFRQFDELRIGNMRAASLTDICNNRHHVLRDSLGIEAKLKLIEFPVTVRDLAMANVASVRSQGKCIACLAYADTSRDVPVMP